MDHLFPTDRLPGVDLATERLALAAQQGDIQSVFLGWAEDQTPIFLTGQSGGEGKPQMLLVGAPSGDCLPGIGAACRMLLEPPAELAEWQIWTIAALDIPGLRKNVAQQGQLRPTPMEHMQVRVQSWAPGEKAESNLPFQMEGYIQPDVYPKKGMPEDLVPSDPESLALARALTHLNPSLVVSLADQPVGVGQIGCSQSLHPEDQQILLEALCPGGRLLVLDPLPQANEEQTQLGGVHTWQWLAHHHPDAIYLQTLPGRFSYPQEEAEPETHDLQVSYQVRNFSGSEKMVAVHTLLEPEHPAHQSEVLVRPTQEGEETTETLLQGQSSTLGILAVREDLFAVW